MKVLLENGIKPDIIAGSSIGALIGGTYAFFGSINKVEELAYPADMKTVFSVFFDPTIKTGLVKGQKIVKFLTQKVGDPYIETLSPIFSAVATNIHTGEEVVFDKGSLVNAIRASISIPFMFQPIELQGMILVDGGLTQNVPAKVVHNKGADVIIAVNLNAQLSNSFYGSMKPPVGLYKIADDSINILQYNLAKENYKYADIIIAPDVYKVGWNSFWKPKEVIKAGEKAAELMLPQILEWLKTEIFCIKLAQ